MDKLHKLQVEAIEKGTVIDHIPAGQGLKIINHLQLMDKKLRLTVGLNLPKESGEFKDLIKVNEWHLVNEEAENLFLFAPDATINQIENYKVVKKYKMKAPKLLKGVFDCRNQNCISLTEPVDSKFIVDQSDKGLRLQCHYCERWFRDWVFV
ncbi:MAG: aspartate carbamoyltransferase regulatory subunit [Saccharospirillaceae bacterium]|nr:aspartate carbamoyltransferase regulatory subunit [Pseudomonadales bacterium]NRB81989.1 aspartate carbamoyltransferase regulatory subunit [Saccharospirillaceae bacterium]